MLLGIDVSNYQRSVNWAALKAAHGLSFGFAKASEGAGYRDPYFAENWRGMAAAGLVRGAYHYARPDHAPAAQAELFWEQVTHAGGWEPGDLLVLDLEETTLNAASTRAWALAWAARIHQRTGVRPGVYTGSYLRNSTGLGFREAFGWWWWPTYPARYRPTTSHPTALATPPAPNVWGAAPDMWQFTDQYAGRYDASVFPGDVAQLRALGGSAVALTESDVMTLCNSATFQAALTSLVRTAVWKAGWTAVDAKGVKSTDTAEMRLYRASHPEHVADALAAAVLAKLPPEQAGGLTHADIAAALREVLVHGTQA